MQTLQDHEAVLRAKCHNGTLYRNDEKLATWLAVTAGDVPAIVENLVSADVLHFDGITDRGTMRYALTERAPGDDYDAWAQSLADKHFGQPEPESSSGIRQSRRSMVFHSAACRDAGPCPATPPDCPACRAEQ